MSELFLPQRGDAVETWIKSWRDEYAAAKDHHDFGGHDAYWALDQMLDDYRLHADTGMPIDQEVSENGW